MERKETIAFTGSLLLLVISMGLSPLYPEEEIIAPPILLCMILVAFTTFIETLSLQKHSIPQIYKKLSAGLSLILAVGVLLLYTIDNLVIVQYLVIGFLIISIVLSMVITKRTKPVKQFQHIEKSNQVFALVFALLVPSYLIFHFGFESVYQEFQIGFLVLFAFIALAVRKIYDDLYRLSLLGDDRNPKEQYFKNYGLTQREQEIATLLFNGMTYQSIAGQLFISLSTVKTHASSIYKKCGVSTRNELVRLLSA